MNECDYTLALLFVVCSIHADGSGGGRVLSIIAGVGLRTLVSAGFFYFHDGSQTRTGRVSEGEVESQRQLPN